MQSCQSFSSILSEPKLSIKSVDLAGINFNGVDLIANVNVENPNSFPIPLPNINWELFIDNASLVQGIVTSSQSIQSRATTTMNIPLNLSYEGLFTTVSSLLNANETAYNIAMGISFPIPFLESKVYNLDFAGILPILKMPEISFQGIAAKSIGTTMEFILNWEVDNKNNFALDIGEFNYDFAVNNTRWAQGRVDNPPSLAGGGKTQIPLTVSISALSMVTELVSIINRGTPVSYTSTGNMSLSSSVLGQNKLELPMNLQGSTRIR
jgi:LEA14-like dessication related protein